MLQNATDTFTECDSYFMKKYIRCLLQSAPGFLLQNATVLLQNATVIANCDDFITKCDSYYTMQRLFVIATVHTPFAKDRNYFIKCLVICHPENVTERNRLDSTNLLGAI